MCEIGENDGFSQSQMEGRFSGFAKDILVTQLRIHICISKAAVMD